MIFCFIKKACDKNKIYGTYAFNIVYSVYVYRQKMEIEKAQDAFQSLNCHIIVDQKFYDMIFSILQSENEYNLKNLKDITIALKHSLQKDFIKKILDEKDIVEINDNILGKKHKSCIHYSQNRRLTSFDNGKIHEYVSPELISTYMKKLCEKQNKENAELFVLEFLRIHPFEDGNGRTAKLIYYLLTGEKIYWQKQKEFIEILVAYREYIENPNFLMQTYFYTDSMNEFIEKLQDMRSQNNGKNEKYFIMKLKNFIIQMHCNKIISKGNI